MYQETQYVLLCFYASMFECHDKDINPVSITAKTDENDMAQVFVDMRKEYTEFIYDTYEINPLEIYTYKDKIAFNNARVCHVCESMQRCGND